MINTGASPNNAAGKQTNGPRRGGLAAAGAFVRANPVATRWLLAGPGAVVAAGVTMAAMPVWLPAGAAGVNNIAVPLLLAPLLWALPFFYVCLEENLARGAAVLLGAIAAQGAVVALALAG